MYKIQVDTEKQCLFLTLGRIDESEATLISSKVSLEILKLRPGFTIVNDISGFVPGTPQVAEIIKATQLNVFKRGVKKVIRVVGSAVISNMQFNRTQREAKASYETIKVATMEDALKLI